jgi:hypothetical protein
MPTPQPTSGSSRAAARAGASQPARGRTAQERAARLMASRRDPKAAREARAAQKLRVRVLTRLALAGGLVGTGALAALVQHQSAAATTKTANLQSTQLQAGGNDLTGNNAGALQGPATPPFGTNQAPQVVSGGS